MAISVSSDSFAAWTTNGAYFVLSELESARGPLGLPIERDLYFEPGPFTKVMARERRNRGG
jgi:hypothetical protein